MPPVPTGISAYSAELVSALARDHDIDVFVDGPVADTAAGHDEHRVRSAHDFIWRHRQRPYDLPVYQLGNSSHHDFLWPYLFRYPGLTVLHDAHLHHARAAALLRTRRADDYRAEFAAAEPEVNPNAAELAVKGFDSFLYYQWPFTRLVIAASRMTAVHSRLVRDDLARAMPGHHVAHVRLGHGTLVEPSEIGTRRVRARRTYGIPEDAVLFGCFGGLTPEKRVPQILDAFESLLTWSPSAWLLLAGPSHEHYDVHADVARHRLSGRVTVAGYVATDEALTDAIAASDVTLNLRWPTAREVSGPWVRCLAAGRPTVVIDLSHTADVPALDPRTWISTAADGSAPVTVAIDIVDEAHSLALALRRLARDAGLRDALGSAARAYWQREHAPGGMLDDYRGVLESAAAVTRPLTALPRHLTDDGTGLMQQILIEFGVPVPWSKI